MHNDLAHSGLGESAHPIAVTVEPALTQRNRLTSAFRMLLAIPHLVLVGAPSVLALSILFFPLSESSLDWGGGGGALGVVAMLSATIAWFAIVFTGRMPKGLWELNAFYLQWRVRAIAYMALLRDEYPPFGEGTYPVHMELPAYQAHRDRVSVAFRILLAIPHLFLLWILSVVWLVITVCTWFAILVTGSVPRALYEFGTGALRWTTNVEGFLLLLHDEYPPFSMH